MTKTKLGLGLMILLCATTWGQNAEKSEAFIPTVRVGVEPLETLVVGDLTYEQVKLTGFQNNIVKFSHALGNKSIPLIALTQAQVDALNTTNEKVAIKPGKLDLTPPSAAAVRRAVELIRQAGDVDGLLPSGNTPLIEAASEGDPEVVKALIARDADVNLRTASDQTAVSVAATARNVRVLRVLREAGARSPDLMAAILSGDVEVVKQSVSKNKDLLKAVDREGMTPLMRAAAEDQPDVITALISLGAAVDETGMTQGRTSLMLAAAAGHDASAHALLFKGATIDAKDQNDWTALMHAADGGKTDVVRALLSKGAGFRVQDKMGETALTLAEKRKHKGVITALQEHVAKLTPAPVAPPSTSIVARAVAAKAAPAGTVVPGAGSAKTIPAPANTNQVGWDNDKDKADADGEAEKKPAPSTVLVLFVCAAFLLTATGHIWLMVVGFQESPWWSVGMFFLNPVVGIFFTIMHPRAGWLPLTLYMIGFLIVYGIPGMHGMAPGEFIWGSD